MKKLTNALFLPLFTLLLLLSPSYAFAETRLQPLSYEPIACAPDCTTLRVYYNQAPTSGWGLSNWGGLMWSGSAGPTNIHENYADYTWGYPYNQGIAHVVLGSGDTVSSPFTMDFSVTEPTVIPSYESVEITGYEFVECGSPTCATVRIHYNQVPPAGGWGLINWYNYTMWSGAAGPTNIHDTYADYTFGYPYVPASSAQYVIASSDDFSSPFVIDWSTHPINNPDPITTVYNSAADTYVKSGSDNRNTGAGVFMRLQSSGDNRSMVKFDQAAIENEIGNKEVLSAKLRVTITDNGNNWGTTGRTIDVHRMLTNWSEGNGTENSRGTSAGATWECAIDSNIANQARDCSGTAQWEMGQPNNPAVHPWAQAASATQTIVNNQSGVVEFDVTSDVSSFLSGTNQLYGWVIKKTNEGQNGQVSFGTKESSVVPQLVITYQP